MDQIEVARRLLDAFNAADWDTFRATLAPDGVLEEVPTGRRAEGADAIVALMQGWKRAFPDGRGTVRNLFGSGNAALLEVDWDATHTGPLVTEQGSIPPSGKSVRIDTVLVLEVEGDQAKLTRHYFDLLQILTPIGAVPAGAS